MSLFSAPGSVLIKTTLVKSLQRHFVVSTQTLLLSNKYRQQSLADRAMIKLPGAYTLLGKPVIGCAVLKNALWSSLLWISHSPPNWIHSKIISEATFHIIGLAKIAKIEFLPLDWIYRSIRIMMVSRGDMV